MDKNTFWKVGAFFLIVIGILAFTNRQLRVRKVAKNNIKKRVAKNIILLIGDGMGVSQISAHHYNENEKSYFEWFEHIGFQKTHSLNSLVTDSAASGTSILGGKKTNNTMVGVTPDSVVVMSLFEEGKDRGYKAGFVVTSTVVHATPAVTYAHQPLRGNFDFIAEDLTNSDFDFIVGGGAKYFSAGNSNADRRRRTLKKKGYLVTEGRPSNKQLSNKEKILWLTAFDNPNYAFEGRRYLPHASTIATNFLNKENNEGFLLMIEGSQIDWALHANDDRKFLEEMKDFDRTIVRMLDFAIKDKETLVIVTGDHECGGLAVNTGKKFGNLKLAYTTRKHTASMVPVFAFGPGAEEFTGVYDNTEIYFKMRKVLGWK